MPIKRRELSVKPTGWTHKIVSRQFVGHFKVQAERVTACEPQIHWAMGHRFDKVREICSSRGWELEILPRKTRSV